MKTKPFSGYTIIEVMIFLAITGLLFASAVVAVGGQQEEVQYSQSVRDFESQIQDVINDVSNGYYPLYEGKCAISGGSVVFSTTTPLVTPGANEDCINVGKALLFNVDGDQDRIGVGTIVGKNPDIGEGSDISLAELDQTMAYQDGAEANPLLLNMTEYKPIRYGARVTKIGDLNTPSTEYTSISFIAGFNSSTPDSSGTLKLNMFSPQGTLSPAQQLATFKTEIEDLVDGDANNRGVFVCLRTANDRRARIIIGDNGSASTVTSEFDIEDTAICP